MKSYLIAIIFLTSILYGEIISEGLGINRLVFAKGVEKGGLIFSMSGIAGDVKNFESDSLDMTGEVKFSYGVNRNFDIGMEIPFSQINSMDSISYSGFGDIGLWCKYNFDFDIEDFDQSIFARLYVPTGYSDPEDNIIRSRFTRDKKVYELGYMLDWGNSDVSAHLNTIFSTLDDFQNDVPSKMAFKYAVGLKYKLLEFLRNKIYVKWEFETTNWLYDFPNYIDGSTYAGISTDLFWGFGLEAGYYSDLYEKSDGYLKGTLIYSVRGSKTERPKKLLEKYSSDVKIDVIEFINENSDKTVKTITEEVADQLSSLDPINFRVLDIPDISLYKNRKAVAEMLKMQNRDLAIHGRIISSKPTVESSFWIPYIMDVPKKGYEIEMEFMVVDIQSGEVVHQNKIKNFEGSDAETVYFRYQADPVKIQSSEIELNESIEKCRRGLAEKLLKEISGRVD